MKFRKITAVLLCILLIMLAGCQSQEGDKSSTASGETNSKDAQENIDVSDMVTVIYAMPAFADMSGADKVEAEINKILAEKWGIQMELKYIDFGVWTEQINLMLTGSGEVDVLMLFATPLTTFVNNGQLLSLDEYYENSSDAFKAVWPEATINATRVGGTLYSITNFRNNANRYTVNMSATIVEEMGINPDDITTLEELEAVLYQVKEAYPDLYPMAPQSQDLMVNGWSWDGLGDEKYLGVLANRGQDEEVKSLFETDDFKDFCTKMRDWYTNGLIMADALSNTESGLTLVQNGKAFAYFNNSTPAKIDGIVKATILDTWAVANGKANLTYGINANTANADESWTLMEALYTDAEISSLLVNGIEGEHWVYTDENKNLLTYPDGVDLSTAAYSGGFNYWAYPNARLSIPWAPSDPTFYEELSIFNTGALQSKASGFAFDSTQVANEYTACSNVMDKYYRALLCGAIEIDTIEIANAEFEAAGLGTIIAEKQAQLDAFWVLQK